MAAELHAESTGGPVSMMPRFGGPRGMPRSPWVVLGLSIVTLGIYHLYWLFKMYQEMADHTGDGPSGLVGLVVGIVVYPVNWFLLPHTVGKTYEQAGMEPGCTAQTGFWNLIPLVGWIVWLFRVQNAMNRYWEVRAV